ncbi:hypothetical protein ACH4JS_26725 [Streptomyces sp. NPDC017638]|uniref:hypothetical protein n=1 Tax=Streptomyces sp. NPDC017638 TaxID=3365004 RepID=UPI00378967EE
MSADFYQPNHTYSNPEHGWAFRVDALTTHPADGELTALGWRLFKGEWEPYAYDRGDWEIGQLAGWTVEQSSRPAADATPGPTGRVARLLDAIRTSGGRWTTPRALRFYRDNVRELDHLPDSRLRTIARDDLRDLAAWGHLVRHEEPGRQFYTLKTRKDESR